ncbi:glycosyltransferase family 2 protein [Salipiger mangrovisoli]|uniref:Glycosyltransferase family 2 protein n=1 Tax=Salipiger mangrovisoli TaxID=2865933 RepID=A0ABR9X9Z8_9RHOB|nr:glycosyltransferase family A protein [Salipiger mangrovisoli]MBE9640416.1 glycosyltransferase family 2 protein [Salipiger mangrovisoli]
MPRFSVVIPCFNAEATIADTIESLLAQTEQDWEALIIDDGSSDDTRLIAASMAGIDLRFRLMKNDGVGPSAARNMALAEADGEIIAFLDADDTWHPEKLAMLDAFFEEETADACFGRVTLSDGRTLGTLSGPYEGTLTLEVLFAENPVCTMSNLAIRLESFLSSGGFNAEITHNADLEWLVRLIGDGAKVVGIDAPLVTYRSSPSGLSSDVEGMKAGRAMALISAARYGFRSSAESEAAYLRRLAARALRLGLSGCATSPAGWFSNSLRGTRILAAALLAAVLPRQLRNVLFSR